MMPNVAIVILNLNGWEDTIECLESINSIDYPNYNVIIADNGSTDNSLIKLREYLSNYIKVFEFTQEESQLSMDNIEDKLNCKNYFLITNKENKGFAEGNNVGIRFALKNIDTDYILLLNSDTTVDKHFLGELIKIIEEDTKIGSVQSLLLNIDGTRIDSLGQEIHIWSVEDIDMGLKNTDNFEDREIFGSCAASALYRKSVFEDIGLFDPDFFVIIEDVDLSWRIRLNGLKSFLASKSIVYHKRGISEPMTIKEIFFKPKTSSILVNWYHGSKNWLIIVLRYFPVKYIFAAIIFKPHKFLFTFYRFIYSSIKLKTLFKGIGIILTNYKIRGENKKNISLEKIQKNCIKFK